MGRGGDWSLVGLASDPTPGNTSGVDTLARRFRQVETTAGDAGQILVRVHSAGDVWQGEAAETFSAQVGDLPANMAKCEVAYGIVADALTAWSAAMDTCQSQADRGLEEALGAQADIDAAQAALEQALANQSWWSGQLATQEELYWRYKDVEEPPSWVDVPSAQSVSSARSQAASAARGVTDAENTLSVAVSRFDAAKKMILAAKQDYEEAAQSFAARVEDAKEESVRKDHWWEAVANSEIWQTIVAIATWVGVIAAFVISGPLGLIIAVVTGAILTADLLLRFANGDIGTGEFLIEAALTFIPGGRIMAGLKGARGAIRGGKAARAAAKKTPRPTPKANATPKPKRSRNARKSDRAERFERSKWRGREYERRCVEALRTKFHHVETNVTIRVIEDGHPVTGQGKSWRVDAMRTDTNGRVWLYELKSGRKTPLSKGQDFVIEHIAHKKSIVEVVGRGKPGFPGGTRISADVAKPVVIRPGDSLWKGGPVAPLIPGAS